ncbi:hypothetical protein, partial [Cronobacter malonaticus]|uniref:hypothetical protein n=1 Tax=Cronobacter malonaticus TaxID=413503 RepID=UPI001F22EB93
FYFYPSSIIPSLSLQNYAIFFARKAVILTLSVIAVVDNVLNHTALRYKYVSNTRRCKLPAAECPKGWNQFQLIKVVIISGLILLTAAFCCGCRQKLPRNTAKCFRIHEKATFLFTF